MERRGSLALDAGLGAPSAIALADADRDGVLDAVVSSSTTSEVQVLRGVLGASFSFAALGTVTETVATGADVFWADANGDGLPDVIVVGPSGVFALRTLAGLGFASSAEAAAGAYAAGAVADLNGDGDLDAVSATGTGATVSMGQ